MPPARLKSHANSARAASAAFTSSFGAPTSGVFGASSSQLAHVTEPPDLSSISDPNVVVYFRNLSKKDSTTKAKALEELQAYMLSLKVPVEDSVLEAWISTYPRTAIDNAKTVRQNAHSLQGHMAKSAGQRMARHMPKAVGAWLSGLYDSDKQVVEATQNSLRQIFSTAEKLQNIRRVYQKPILEYCRDAIDKESATTLSDERTVTPDDAAAKYSRVISACISLLGSLLSNLTPEQLSKFQGEYDTLLGDKKLWEFASHSDAPTRRSIHRFLRICVDKVPATIASHLEILSKSYLANALNSDQTGSAYDYVETLSLMTSKYPTVWTNHYHSKTTVTKRLRQYLEKGSQLGPRDFWARLLDVFNALPKEVLPQSSADAAALLNSLHAGIIRKDESRFNLESAYRAYLKVADIMCESLPEDKRPTLLRETVLPITSQYLRPTPINSDWTMPANSVSLVSASLAIRGMSNVARDQWPQYIQSFVDEIKTSAPEQSKDYDDSQSSLIKQASRLSSLQHLTLISASSTPLQQAFTDGCVAIITNALAVVKNRNGKPYGAAGAVAEILAKNRSLVSGDRETESQLLEFIQEDLPQLILSPSSSQVVDILYSLSDTSAFKAAWSASLKAALSAEDSPVKAKALDSILTSSKIPASLDLTLADPDLQNYVKLNVQSALQGDLEWDTFSRVLHSPTRIISSSTTDEILSSMTNALSLAEQAPNALHGFHQIIRQNPALLKTFISSAMGTSLLHGLLMASESPDEDIAHEAAAVNASIQTLLSSASDSKQSVFDVIQHGLREATPTSVSVETLVDLASQMVKPSTELEETMGAGFEQVKGVFPSLADWDSALAPFLELLPRPSLAITNPMGGAIYLAQSGTSDARGVEPMRDNDGYSPAYRIAIYVTKLYKQSDLFQTHKLPLEVQRHILHNLSATVHLASDNLGLARANNLWTQYNTETEADAMAFLSDAQTIISQDMKLQEGDSWLDWIRDLSSAIPSNYTAKAYYEARVYSSLLSEFMEMHGWNKSLVAQVQEIFTTLRRSKSNDTFQLLCILNAFKEPLAASKSCERMCNELVADLTGLDIEAKPIEGLRQLVLLNTILYGQQGVAESIAKQRLIFFVKHVVPWLANLETRLPIRAEVCRALVMLLPLMSDIYGEHWGEILSVLAKSWTATNKMESGPGTDSPTPYVHSSLKLYALLRSLTQSEDPNDDLLDVWGDTQWDLADGLINLLKCSTHFVDEFHQPLKIVNEVLARQIAKVPHKHWKWTSDLFALIYVESQPVQQTAFDILHKQIPEAQEQISIDAALDKKTARLPLQLLSLILDAPTIEKLASENFERSIPLGLRGYLLSWLLVFDHLEHASFKVKNDYIDHIKEGDYLPGLLNFMFEFLGHAHNKPVDVSKLDITTYVPDIEAPRRDAQWLLTHLYFLCLRHIPSLTKSWWIDCKSRPIVVNLEPWTEKFVSPPVISAALESVNEWATSQLDADPDSPFTVKVSLRAREITTSYLVDEQTLSMRISLPPGFPLANASIESVHRVAVNEQKWQSFLRTSLGAITIFNGSIIDALMTFKKNVEGAMKGQTECAICYAIVGADRRLPDKRCQTCKNKFHGGCLAKWFRTSGASTCPLCRNQFHYG